MHSNDYKSFKTIIIIGFVPLENIAFIWSRCYIAGEELQNLGRSSGKDLYRATPALTRSLGFCGLTHRTKLFSRLLPQDKDIEDLIKPGSPRD